MGAFQYKSGANWVDVPDYAHPADDSGTVMVEHPQTASIDGLGRPCGAVGQARIVIRSPQMPGTGWAWYQNFFANTTDLTATLAGLTAYDPRTGTWRKFTGTLTRPVSRGVQPGATAARTLYADVEIAVLGITETS